MAARPGRRGAAGRGAMSACPLRPPERQPPSLACLSNPVVVPWPRGWPWQRWAVLMWQWAWRCPRAPGTGGERPREVTACSAASVDPWTPPVG